MAGGDRLVRRDSAIHLEFVRLYQLARRLRPTSVDRWNRDLYASDSENSLGGFSPRTGAIRLSGSAVLPYLTGSTLPHALAEQSQALATVLHEATHATVATDDPREPNAVRSAHTRGLMEGVAELRAFEDFRLFTRQAGYFGLAMPRPQYEGAFTATDSLVSQASGTRLDRVSIINDLTRGPAVAHFDRLAHGVVQNRLWDVVPPREDHQRAVRAALIPAMTHELWPSLHDERTTTGNYVAEQVRQSLNAKVDEIRRHYRFGGRAPFGGEEYAREAERGPDHAREAERGPDDVPEAGRGPNHVGDGRNQGRARGDAREGLRFLDAQAGAVARRPQLGQGVRGAGSGRELANGGKKGLSR